MLPLFYTAAYEFRKMTVLFASYLKNLDKYQSIWYNNLVEFNGIFPRHKSYDGESRYSALHQSERASLRL